jgi:hypothetical protein
MNREPNVTVGAVTAAVTAVLTLVVAFGVPLGAEQQAAILGVVAVLAPLVATAVARRHVWPDATVQAEFVDPAETHH